jgi:hypothetical protein
MDYFWKENKKYVIAVGGALAAALLYNAFFLSSLRAAAGAAAQQRKNERRELEARAAQGVPGEEALRAARAERDQSRKLLGALATDVAFKGSDRFRKPGDAARAHYDDQKIRLNEELRDRAVKARIAYTPFALADDGSDENVAEYLQRLSAVERLAGLAIESDVEKIEAIDASAGRRDADEDDAKKAVFLRKYSIFMKFSGKAESVFKVLHGAQKRGAYLTVTQFEARRPDASKDLFDASITVALLKVDDKAPLEAK